MKMLLILSLLIFAACGKEETVTPPDIAGANKTNTQRIPPPADTPNCDDNFSNNEYLGIFISVHWHEELNDPQDLDWFYPAAHCQGDPVSFADGEEKDVDFPGGPYHGRRVGNGFYWNKI